MFVTMRENVEGCRRTTSVGKIKKRYHDNPLFILGFEWRVLRAAETKPGKPFMKDASSGVRDRNRHTITEEMSP
jgi:hypothetical protein